MTKVPDERSIEILADVLEKTTGGLDSLNTRSYRIDNPEDISRIDELSYGDLLKPDKNHKTFRVGHMGLFFIESSTSKTLFKDINRLINYLKKHINNNPDEELPVLLSQVTKSLRLPRARINECASYLQDCVSIGTSSNIQKPDAYVMPSIRLLQIDKFEACLEQRARSGGWFPELFEDHNEEPHGNKERFAQHREDTLGAALTVLAEFPDECAGKNGKIQGTKIAQTIDAKSLLLFKNKKYDGDPPLSHEVTQKLINKWLYLLKEKNPEK